MHDDGRLLQPRLHIIPTEHDVPFAFVQRLCMPPTPSVLVLEHSHVPLRCVCVRNAWYSCVASRDPFSTTRTGTRLLLSSGTSHSGTVK
jgi:hypothetical protein